MFSPYMTCVVRFLCRHDGHERRERAERRSLNRPEELSEDSVLHIELDNSDAAKLRTMRALASRPRKPALFGADIEARSSASVVLPGVRSVPPRPAVSANRHRGSVHDEVPGSGFSLDSSFQGKMVGSTVSNREATPAGAGSCSSTPLGVSSRCALSELTNGNTRQRLRVALTCCSPETQGEVRCSGATGRPTDRPRFGTAGLHWFMVGRCTQAAKLEQLRLIATVAEAQLCKLPLTHLVLGGTKRTLKYLFAVAQGTLRFAPSACRPLPAI